MSDLTNSLEYAKRLDAQDPLALFRGKFHLPQHNGKDSVYFTGNSLGLQPRSAKDIIETELNDWAKYGVEGHFHAKHPWYSYHEMFAEPLSKIVGAKPIEVVAMNGLTVNLHLLMVSFYRPTQNRYKIICEAKAFPSDQYALESQVRFHGRDPNDAIIEIAPREGQHTIETDDILLAIEEHGNELAMVMIGGVNYYSGQLMDMEKITAAGQAKGAKVGFDLAHAAGNVKLDLHDWGVDFAAWCSYKYMNSGPGSVAGAFVHERHKYDPDLPRFAGWWGYNKETRFKMEPGFDPILGAEGWQLSNAPVFSMAIHKASLDIFDDAGISNLIEKSKKLTAFLEFIIEDISSKKENVSFEIITPKDPYQRGCQLSILCHGQGRSLFDHLTENGVFADWREPNVIRIAPVPLYNSFEDVYRFGEILNNG
ncbi:MAG: kynureninase [Flavobacteriales bacterium]|nr:kynureninase [Flavobacteriales bacterium]